MIRRSALRIAVPVLILGLGLAVSQTLADDAPKSIYQKTLRATCWVRVPGVGSGTGWVVDMENKLVVTNHHVVENEDRVIVIFPQFKNGKVIAENSAYSEDRGVRGKVLDTDKARDLAVIQLIDAAPNGTHALKLAADSPDPSDHVHSIGNPGASDALWVYTSGTVRQVHNTEWSSLDFERKRATQRKAKVVQTQAPINAGDSGGPVVNDQGELIGVNSSCKVRDRNGDDVRLITQAIDIHEVRAFVDQTRRLMEPKTAADFVLRGDRLLERGKFSEAITDFSAALKLDRNNSTAYRRRGWGFACKGDHDTTIADCNEAIRLDPDDAVSYENRAWAYDKKGDLDKAIADYTRAIQLDPKFSLAYNNRGVVYFKRKDLQRALADYTRAIEADPKNAVAWGNRGDTYRDLKEHEKSITDCNRALELNPFLIHAWNARGWAFRELKMQDEHVDNFKRALRYDDKSPTLWVSLGNALTFKGQWKDAVTCYNKALEFDKKHAPAFFFRASASEEFGLIKDARTDYEKAMELEPGYKSLVKTHKRCYLRVVNDTKEVLRVYVQYEYEVQGGGWTWYPNDPPNPKNWRVLDVQPGKNVQLLDDDWKVECRRAKIWAEGRSSNLVWNTYKEKDWWLCDQDGYLAQKKVSQTFTFK